LVALGLKRRQERIPGDVSRAFLWNVDNNPLLDLVLRLPSSVELSLQETQSDPD
jgi:hypothetical protein